MTLKESTFKGLIWSVADSYVLKGLVFIAGIILARILGPEEFGLMGMISILIAVGTSLVDSGMAASLIRSKEIEEVDLNTVFILNLAFSVLVYVLMLIVAPLVADFFSQKILVSIIRVYSLSFLIQAFSSVQLAKLMREMQFRRVMMLNIPGTIIGVITGILMGMNGVGVWSIVIMHLIIQFTYAVLLWFGSGWRPKMRFSRKSSKYHYGYGYKLMLSGLIDTVFNNIYNVIIGKFFSVQTLGYFERSKAINDYPVTSITSIINKVSFPLLAKIQDDKQSVSSIYKRIILFTFFITAPLMLGLAALAEPLFLLILGDQWVGGVLIFQMLSFSAIFYPIHAFNVNVLKVYGRSDLFLKLELYKKSVIVVALISLIGFGIYGLVASIIITSVSALLINSFYSGQMIDYPTKRQLLDLLPTFAISLFTAALMFVTNEFWINSNKFIGISISVVIGVVCYFGSHRILKTEALEVVVNFLIKKMKT
ncbi:lipopolysaccharide biosynthesis protein [Robertkochia flava]|uniref:lipopolysaccharide biosynthesis protein n=1 Tax=Robertkochia flava TaxID=3447986 RepID=UPI001CCD04CC|nr:lipopolysaccharide biosynthesis protein [Robertkochia marina]